MITAVCEHCGGSFRLHQSDRRRVGRQGGRFCSRACKSRAEAAAALDPVRISKRFWSKVDKNGPVLREELGPCWIWTGTRLKGYGQIGIGSKVTLAHRAAFFLAHGRWPNPCALHRCDGGSIGCVRPDHLYEGTVEENNADRERRGRTRSGRPRGEHHGNSKLTDDAVRDIRRARESGEPLKVIAARFRIDLSTVSDIARRRTWRHVT